VTLSGLTAVVVGVVLTAATQLSRQSVMRDMSVIRPDTSRTGHERPKRPAQVRSDVVWSIESSPHDGEVGFIEAVIADIRESQPALFSAARTV
jgi:hypothetical protein